jgi:hypothetical protein
MADPERRAAMSRRARPRRGFRMATHAEQVEGVYRQAIEAPEPRTSLAPPGTCWRARPTWRRAVRRATGPRLTVPVAPLRPAQVPQWRAARLGLSAVLVSCWPCSRYGAWGRNNVPRPWSKPRLGADRAGAVLHFDGAARRVWYHIVRRASRPAGEEAHGHERHRNRGADVGDAATPGEPRVPTKFVSRRIGRMRETLPVGPERCVAGALNLLALLLLAAGARLQ